ncbi:S100 calcium binding protein W [Synchiropus picturatus]
MARLDEIITSLADIFIEYSGEDCKKRQLDKDELKKLFEKEIESPQLQGTIDIHDVEEAMAEMDKNHDGQINFREFCRAVCLMSKCYYHKKTGKESRRGKKEEDKD